jgi:hypothetical protein
MRPVPARLLMMTVAASVLAASSVRAGVVVLALADIHGGGNGARPKKLLPYPV